MAATTEAMQLMIKNTLFAMYWKVTFTSLAGVSVRLAGSSAVLPSMHAAKVAAAGLVGFKLV
jgi:hypothetical protein